MGVKRRQTLLLAIALEGADRTPPKELRLFAYGMNATRKGNFLLTPNAAQQIMMAYKAHGTDLCLDYDHGALEAPVGQPTPAAGWAKLELRDDGLWLASIKWTATAHDMISKGEYRYVSPAFDADIETLEIVDVINCAITNIPAMDNQRPMVAASRRHAMNFREILAAYSKRSGATVGELCEVLGVDTVTLKRFALGKAPSNEEMKKMKGKAAEMKCDIFSGETENAPINASLDGMDVNASAASIFEASMPMSSGSDSTSTSSSASNETTETSRAADEADEDQGSATPSAAIGLSLKRMQKSLIELTGTADPVEQAGILHGWKLAKDAQVTDHKELEKLKRDSEKRERTELVELGKREGKLTPGLISFYAEKPINEFRAFLKVAPVLGLTSDGGQLREPAPLGSDGLPNGLTPEQALVEQLLPGEGGAKAIVALSRQLAPSLLSGGVIARTLNAPEFDTAIRASFISSPDPEGWMPRKAAK